MSFVAAAASLATREFGIHGWQRMKLNGSNNKNKALKTATSVLTIPAKHEMLKPKVRPREKMRHMIWTFFWGGGGTCL
jgi:hypothetical protein